MGAHEVARARVLHFITRLDLGGAQQVALYSVAHLDRHQFDVGLLAGQGGLLDDKARQMPETWVQLNANIHHAISPLNDLRATLKLARLLRAERVDVLHTHSSKAGVLGRMAATLANTPVVVHTVHGWSFNPTQAPLVRQSFIQLERLCAAVTDQLVVVSERDGEAGRALGIGTPERYRVIRAGIDVAAMERKTRTNLAQAAPARAAPAIRAELGFVDAAIVVGTISALKPQKAPLDFVRAASIAHAIEPRLRFFIAGDGELAGEVKAEIARLRLDDVVKMLGWRNDLPELLAAADLFLLTSLFEGLPRAVLQAQASATPVIATAVNGTVEVVVDEETGLLVPAQQPSEAAAAVLRLARDPAMAAKFARQAKKRLRAEFEMSTMVEQLGALYAEQLSEAKGARVPRWRRLFSL